MAEQIMAAARRRAYSEESATNFADPLTVAWPNHQKVFFNNKGRRSPADQNLRQDPAADTSVWNW